MPTGISQTCTTHTIIDRRHARVRQSRHPAGGSAMVDRRLPRAYRWLIQHSLIGSRGISRTMLRLSYCQPTSQRMPGCRSSISLKQERTTTFTCLLVRQDQDELAYFVVSPEGEIEDSVLSVHLVFAPGFHYGGGPNSPPPARDERMTFFQWIKDIAARDVEDWIMDDET